MQVEEDKYFKQGVTRLCAQQNLPQLAHTLLVPAGDGHFTIGSYFSLEVQLCNLALGDAQLIKFSPPPNNHGTWLREYKGNSSGSEIFLSFFSVCTILPMHSHSAIFPKRRKVKQSDPILYHSNLVLVNMFFSFIGCHFVF